MDQQSVKNIFISYRVQDTAGETGRLVDDLKQHFADDQLFMDIDNLEPGVEFPEVIEKYLLTCQVMLVIIGPNWIGNRNNGTARINDPNDWIRMEVSSALQRKILIIPILVDGASFPKEEELPPEIRPLLNRQSYELSNKRWQYDTDRLIDFLINIVGIASKKTKDSVKGVSTFSKKFWIYMVSGLAVILIVSLIIINLPRQKNANGTITPETQSRTQPPTSDSAAIVDTIQSSTAMAKPGAENLSGTWTEDDPGIKSSFILNQKGNSITVQVQALGQIISTGTGKITGKNVELRYEVMGMSTVLKGKLSDDRNRISGTYTMESTNDPQPIVLVRQK